MIIDFSFLVKTSQMSLTHKITSVPNSQNTLKTQFLQKNLDLICISFKFQIKTRKYADTFRFTLEYVVILLRKNVFWIKKNWFWLMPLPARNYPVALNDCHEAVLERRPILVFSMMKNKLKQLCSIWLRLYYKRRSYKNFYKELN